MKPGFSAWKIGMPYYLPLLVIGGGVTAFGWGSGLVWLGVAILLAGLFCLNFFRDPPRAISSDPLDIVSPADGVVVAIESLDDTEHYDGPCQRVSIFLSVFNVHVNRIPYPGTITKVVYKEGVYKNAMSAESSKVNESNAIWMDTPAGPMTVRQISGAVARRIICLPEPGDTLEKGVRLGMIKFGSRTELYMPVSVDITVSLKQRVKGGASIIGRAADPGE